MDKGYYIKKTIGPTLPPTILHRQSLVDALNKAITRTPLYKLVLLCAPAGYGKTTLLADFVEHTTISCCWCFLDRTDADKLRFLELLLFSIRQCFQHFGSSLDVHLTNTIEAMTDEPDQLYHLENFLDAFITALPLEIPERFALILCNYHEINHSPIINRLMTHLLQRLPPQYILILESRETPNLEFGSLLVHHEVFGLGSRELSFNVDEIYQIAQIHGMKQFSRAESMQIVQSFGGWIAGIVLSTHLGDLHTLAMPDGSSWDSPAIRMERKHILTYLLNEVFAHENDAYVFLRDIIILHHLNSNNCNALLSISDAGMRLAYLERHGLFVSHYGEGREHYYYCHPIIREVLYEELRILLPRRFHALHLRAVEFFQTSQDYEQAIYHALAVSAYDVAAVLIEQHYKSMFIHGYSSTLADWIDALPKDIQRQHPQLLLARANILLMVGEHILAGLLLDDAYEVIKLEEDETSTLLAEILIIRGKMLSKSCDYMEAQALSQQALSLLPSEETALRIEAHLSLGVCACLLCNFTSGIVELRQALQLHGNEIETRQTARLHTALANAYDMVGLHILSEHHRICAIRCWKHLNDEWGKLDSLIGLSWTKHRQGNYVEAEQLLNEVLSQAQSVIQYRHSKAYALINLGELYLDQEFHQRALSSLDEGLTIAYQVRDSYLAQSALCTLAMAYLLMGDFHTPQLLLSQFSQANGVSITYELILRELMEGTILLWQCRYEEAYMLLTDVEVTLRAVGLKREHLQVAIRRAACLYVRREIFAMTSCLNEAWKIAKQSGYEALFSIEINRHAELVQAMQALPETAHINHLLRKTGKEQSRVASVPQANTSAQLQPSIVTVHTSSTQARPSLRILALGEPMVYLNGTLVKRWRMQRTMHLFFFLLNANRPVHKEQIIGALWQNSDEQIDQALRSSIYFLRKLLGASCVVSHSGTYMLDLSACFGKHVWYDVAIFRENYEVAKVALTANDNVVARSTFAEMTRLYRGHYVQSFYSDWCSSARSDLKYAYIDAHLHLAQMAWSEQQIDECIVHWRHLLEADSCLEEAHYGLMNCYIQQGKRGLALRQYQLCVTLLRDELAIAPGIGIQTLYQNLVSS